MKKLQLFNAILFFLLFLLNVVEVVVHFASGEEIDLATVLNIIAAVLFLLVAVTTVYLWRLEQDRDSAGPQNQLDADAAAVTALRQG